MATRPASIPLHAIVMSGLPNMKYQTSIAVAEPATAARFVLMAITEIRRSVARVRSVRSAQMRSGPLQGLFRIILGDLQEISYGFFRKPLYSAAAVVASRYPTHGSLTR
jgi:hypothetical protein